MVEPLEQRCLLSVGPLDALGQSLTLRPNYNSAHAAASESGATASPTLSPALAKALIAAKPQSSTVPHVTAPGGPGLLKAGGAAVDAAASPSAAPGSATSTTVYSTGFEASDGFTPGFLGTQAGWSEFGGNTTQPVISTDYPVFGTSQELTLGNDPTVPEDGSALVGGFSPDKGPQSVNGTYTVSVDFMATSPAYSGQYMGGPNFYFAVLGDSNGDVATDVCFYNYQGAGYIFVMTNNVQSQVNWYYTGWMWGAQYPIQLTMSLDATTNQINFYANGWNIFRGAVWYVSSPQQIVAYDDNLNPSDGVVGIFDNLDVQRTLIIPARAASWWSDRIVVSDTTGTNTDNTLYPSDSLYVDWAVKNVADTPADPFYSSLYVDGALSKTWQSTPSLAPGDFFSVLDYDIGSLGIGPHQFTLVPDTDANGNYTADAWNNSYTKMITVNPFGAIDGSIYGDTNGDGAWDGSETGVANWTVYLDMNHSGHWDPGDPTATTDSNGVYQFTGLEAGDYVVGAEPPPGAYAAAAGVAGSAAASASESVPVATSVELGAGQTLHLAATDVPFTLKAKIVAGPTASSVSPVLAAASVAASGPAAASYPSSFDLRNLGDVTPVEDQGALGGCWAFSTYGALESSILMAGGPVTTFSENDLKDYSGFDSWPNGGGNDSMSQAYLSRGSGPVNASDSPYVDWDDVPASRGTPQYYVRDSLVFDTPDKIKAAVMQYGALSTDMCWDNGSYNSTDSTYYYSGTQQANHAVTIVGWDDSVATAAPTPGAWLIKNSWGTGFGNQGYFWISYGDAVAGHTATGYINAVPASTFNHIDAYDQYGEVEDFNASDAFNAFTPDTNQLLKSVQFYTTADNAGYQVSVYDTFSGGQLSGLLSSTSGTDEFPGYHTVDLPSSVPLTAGQAFYVYVHIDNGGDYPMAASSRLAGYSSNASSAPGESYYFDGDQWVDLTTFDPTANFCIKALTVDVPVPGTLAVSLSPGAEAAAQNLGVAPLGAKLANGGPVHEGSSATVTFSNQYDISPADVAAGFHYAYDFNNDGAFEIGDGSYAGSVSDASATVPVEYLAAGPGNYVVHARVIDQDGYFVDYTTTITVTPVPSDLVLSLSAATINENDSTTLSGTFADPGTLDTHTVVITWGDGTTDTLQLGSNVLSFSQPHQYLANLPQDAAYPVGVTVTNSDNASTAA